jgi:eukaryotic-like serine/threonine-protein kinase
MINFSFPLLTSGNLQKNYKQSANALFSKTFAVVSTYGTDRNGDSVSPFSVFQRLESVLPSRQFFRHRKNAARHPGASWGVANNHEPGGVMMDRSMNGAVELQNFHREQRRRWQLGDRALIESILEGHESIGLHCEFLLDLVYNEIVLREKHRESPRCDEYLARFPGHAAELQQLFDVHRAFGGADWLSSTLGLTGNSSLFDQQTNLKTAAPVDWTGRTISHYGVEQRIGAGGMGEVYVANDLALGRRAAIKFLPPRFSSGLRLRLLAEAKTSARLQHPGIATFFEAGEPEGVAFIAMEYVRGETLRQRLKEGPIPVDQSVAIITCLLEALAHAHAVGILHRDVKPENIMLTGPRSAKLLDFGIAKQIGLEHGDSDIADANRMNQRGHTRGGAIIGTPGYMSPEQIRGEALDARTDLFAVGVVLYEALTGRSACLSSTVAGRLAATLSDPLPLLEGAGVPAELMSVLGHALARNRSERHPSATAFLKELQALEFQEENRMQTGTIAVIDLENLSANPDHDWIGSGIADHLREDFGRLPDARIVTRKRILQTCAAREKVGAPASVSELGLALGARWVMSGSYEMAEPNLQITARLTDVPTGQLLWTEELSGTLDSIFSIQEKLAAATAASLHLQRTTPNGRRPADLNAYEFYLRGRLLTFKMDKSSIQQAQECFEQAIRLDSNYGPALAGLAGMHALRYIFTTDPKTLETAEAYATRALEAHPDLSEAHQWLGYIRFQQARSYEGLLAQLKALECDPGNQVAAYFAGTTFILNSCRREQVLELRDRIVGAPGQGDPHHWRREHAVKLLQHSIELDPQHTWSWLALGMGHLELRNYPEAEWCLREALKVEINGPGSWSGMAGFLAECLRRRGDLDQARAHCLGGLEAIEKSDDAYRDTFRGVFLCTLGRTALQQRDCEAASAAFTQAVLLIRGRHQARGGGHVLVQALAGLTQVGAGPEPFEEALELFTKRQSCHFGDFWGCMDDISLLELARAAKALGRTGQARQLLDEALDAGSVEAEQETIP